MKNARLFLSLALFTFAIAGAFTNKTAKAALTNFPGYIKQNGTCVYKNECSDDVTSTLCTVTNSGGSRIYGMDQGDCTLDLWRVH
ncbi:DUF6520 family protein [Flavobacterium sp.]